MFPLELHYCYCICKTITFRHKVWQFVHSYSYIWQFLINWSRVYWNLCCEFQFESVSATLRQTQMLCLSHMSVGTHVGRVTVVPRLCNPSCVISYYRWSQLIISDTLFPEYFIQCVYFLETGKLTSLIKTRHLILITHTNEALSVIV